jgi:hypothetical protein
MSEPTPTSRSDQEGNLADELAHIPYEPLLPVEKKLIVGSLLLGVLLLGILLWLSSTFFAVPLGPQ